MPAKVTLTTKRVKKKGGSDPKELLRQLNKGITKVGFPSGGDVRPDDGTPQASIAAIQEYGSEVRNIPARPFMRKTSNDQNVTRELRAIKAAVKSRVLAGTLTPSAALSMIGEYYAGAVKQKITNGRYVPLQPSTVAARPGKSKKPLIDTGLMRAAVTHVEEL